jgi:DNA repair ATPase RecN
MQESDAKQVQSRLADLKSMLHSQTAESQACQTSEGEASDQFNMSRSKLTEMQERIERLDKTLEKLSGAYSWGRHGSGGERDPAIWCKRPLKQDNRSWM